MQRNVKKKYHNIKINNILPKTIFIYIFAFSKSFIEKKQYSYVPNLKHPSPKHP
jgi:hypothetical protein